MKFTILSTACLFILGVTAAPILQLRGTGFDFMNEKVRGVNAGGWLLLEPWITPSLFTNGAVDEHTLTASLGKNAALRLLRPHWSSFYTQQDFLRMAAVGLNTVRIPIGYWAFTLNEGDPYIQGQAEHLDRAIGWARKAGLKVWIDLHGAPGGQNGFDNSGLRDNIGWQQGDTVKQTLAVLKKIADKYGKEEYHDTVVVIELLNEPMGPKLDFETLKQFYLDGWGQVRDVSGGDTWVAFSDAFLGVQEWNGVLSEGGNNVLVDMHHYQVFSEEQVSRSFDEQIGVACGAAGALGGADKLIVVGEWSGAMTDCARWLNGYGRGTRYEGTFQSGKSYGDCATKGNIDSMDDGEKDQLRKYLEAQLTSWEQLAGWIFWTWKAEEGNMNDDWNYSKLVWSGIMPNPPTDRKYPGICG